ncbi:nucleolar protein 4-like isoform X4 [Cavia porcellus]|uniref:nucleolar protein 4-like isoform X4 n=2 Tax=Cavia porcellus TaxID=10141 RepID=UPI002FDF48A5
MPKPTLLLRGGWERERNPGDSELGRQFRDWCLRTYGDSAKTKTVTRSKYQRIAEVLQGGGGTGAGSGPAAGEKGKFQFWVRSKGFRLGSGREPKMGQVVYVPVKTGSGADGLSEPEGISLKRVAVVEDFFDIIYSMHVESSAEPGKAPKHAGQKKTYRAIAETYAFLPREAVTRFLMSCTECQKRMHFNSNGLEPKENEPASPLVSGIIDYNMPLTSTYLKQMKLRVMNSQEQDETSVSSEDFDMNDSTWMSADPHLASSLSPSQDERMRSPQNLHSQEDGPVGPYCLHIQGDCAWWRRDSNVKGVALPGCQRSEGSSYVFVERHIGKRLRQEDYELEASLGYVGRPRQGILVFPFPSTTFIVKTLEK